MKGFAGVCLAGLLLVAALSVYLASGGRDKPVFDIAVAGPLSGPYAEAGRAMQQGAAQAIADINASGVLPNITLRLLSEDDQSEALSRYGPQESAKRLVKNPRLLAVVGHYFSTPSSVAAAVYAQHEVPMITPAATHPGITANNPWAFSLLYTDAQQGSFLAHYAHMALKRQRIAVIHAGLPQDGGLKDAFLRQLAELGVKPQQVLALPFPKIQPDALLPHQDALRGADLILLAMPADYAAAVASHLRNKQIHADFMGGIALGQHAFMDAAGIYAEGTYALSAFLPDLQDQKARLFARNYQEQYGQPPDAVAAQSYEAIQVLAQAVGREGTSRQGIRRYLASLNNPQRAVRGIGGPIHFDKQQVNLRPLSVGKVVNGRPISAEYQLVPVKYPELAKIRGDKAALINEQMLKASTVMFTGMVVHDIHELNVPTGRFKGDFTTWFRWNSREKPEIDFELANGMVINRKIVEEHSDPKNGEKYLAYRVEAAFQQDFPMNDYPFDVQTLKIQVRPKGFASEDVILVKDFSERNDLAQRLSLGVWVDDHHLEYVDQDEYIYSFRSPRFDKKTYFLNHAIFNYDITIHRNVLQYLIKLMPLLIVMLAAYLTFFLDVASALPPRLSISITSLLSAVAFHMSQSANASNIGYLIKADYFFMLTYWLIFFSLAETIISKRIQAGGQAEKAARLDFYSSWAYLFLIVLAVLLLVYL